MIEILWLLFIITGILFALVTVYAKATKSKEPWISIYMGCFSSIMAVLIIAMIVLKIKG